MSDLPHYTERQLLLYYGAATRQIRRARAALFTDVRLAFGAKKEDARNHIANLNKE